MIRKSNVVKGIPMILVRALPTLYYYGRYALESVPHRANLIFNTNVGYLAEAIKILASAISDHETGSLATEVKQLSQLETKEVEKKVYQITSKLSDLCLKQKDVIKSKYEGTDGLKESLTSLYSKMVTKTKVLLIDNNNEPDWVDKLSTTLVHTCHYDVLKTKPDAEMFSDNMIASDFVIFASATPQSINEDVEYLKIYHKPGLILANIKKDEKLDQQTLRNGSWLQKCGYDVLYKIFSPMRLFTSIDRINIRFLLQEA